MRSLARGRAAGLLLAMLGAVFGGSDTCAAGTICAAETVSSASNAESQAGGVWDDSAAAAETGSSMLARNKAVTQVAEQVVEEEDQEDLKAEAGVQETTDDQNILKSMTEDLNEGLEEQEAVEEVSEGDTSETAALRQDAVLQEHAARERYLNDFQAMLDSSLGSNGAAVVMRFDSGDEPCPPNTFLEDTFVHADLLTGTFICKPCHAACSSGCTRGTEADCLGTHSASSLAGVSAARSSSGTMSRSAFADSFAVHLQTQHEDALSSLDKFNTELDEFESSANLTKCLADGACTFTEYNATESSSVDTTGTTVEFVHATALRGNLTDPMDLKSDVQKSLNQGLQDAGFIPGMTKASPLWDETDNITNVTEDGPPNTPPGADSGLKQGSLLELEEERHCESLFEAKLNVSRRGLTYTLKNKIKGAAKDWVRAEAKKRAKDYAKQSLKNWIQAQEGDCLDALDEMIGVSQRVYNCFKEHFGRVKSLFCEPGKQHDWLTPRLKSVVQTAQLLKQLSNPFKTVPYVNGVANNVHRLGGQIDNTLAGRVRTLENMKQKPHGTRIAEQPGCCAPFPESGCSAYPGAAYKCASCSAGGICYLDRGCNTLERLESKVDQWKAQYYDPILEKIAEATQYVQAANNAADQAANAASWLAKCSGGSFNKCSQVKKLAMKIVNTVDHHFTNKICPLPFPNIPWPNINPIKSVLDFLAKIANVFRAIEIELRKPHCISVPRVKVWTERKCTRVCTPCCSYHGRRRWTGSVRCRSCCHSVCAPVPKTRAWMQKYCFSGMDILKGIAGFIQKFLGPVLKILEKAINFLLSPIRHLIDKILGLLNINVNFPFPSLPSFNFNLPGLPRLDCNLLKQFAGAVGVPDASGAGEDEDALVTKKPVYWLKAANYDPTSNTWKNSGSAGDIRSVRRGGTLSTNQGSGYGASARITYVQGSYSTRLYFGNIVTSTDFTFCSLTRYTSGRKGRILLGGGNWLFGHWNGRAGVAHTQRWVTGTNDRKSINWVAMCARSGGGHGKVLLDGGNIGNGQRVDRPTNGEVGVNFNGGRSCCTGEVSDFAIAEILVWQGDALRMGMDRLTRVLRTAGGSVGFSKKPVYWLKGDMYDARTNTWRSLGSRGDVRSVVRGGRLYATKRTGYGASNNIPYVYGNSGTRLYFGNIVTSSDFTFCSLTRYTGNRKGRILLGGGNWLFGHWAGRAGVAHTQRWVTSASHDRKGHNWVAMCARSGGGHGKVLLDGSNIGNGHRVDRPTHGEVGVNFNGGHSCCTGETSDFAIAEIIVWQGDALQMGMAHLKKILR